LPDDLRAQLKGRVLPFYENQSMPSEVAKSANEVRIDIRDLVKKSANTIEPAWQELGNQLAMLIEDSVRKFRKENRFL
jgi:hypothetical protein